MSAPTTSPDHLDATPPVALKDDARVMALVGLAHATSHFSHLLLPPLFPVLMHEFGLSFSQAGLLVTVFFVVSGLGQASAGFVVDRLGARPVLFAALWLFAGAALLASSAQSYATLVAVAVLAGLGNAPFHPVDFSILNQRVSAPRLGHAFSVHGLTGNLGWAAAPIFLVSVAALTHWRTAYVAAALLYVVVFGVLFWQRDQLKTEVLVRAPGSERSADLAFLRLPVVWWCFAFFLFSTVTLAVVQTYAAPIMQAVHGFDLEAATWTVTTYMLCGAAGMVAGGFIAARSAQADRVVGAAMAAGAALMVLTATGWLGGVGTFIALACTGVAVGIAGPSRDMMIRRATPKGATGRVYGTVYSGLDVGFALSPLLFGPMMDRGWYGWTLAGAAGVLLLAVYAALGVGQRTRTDTTRAAA